MTARRDLVEIWSFIARDSEPAADRFIDLIISRLTTLGQNPYIGGVREDLRSGYRSFATGQYVIIYPIASLFISKAAREFYASSRGVATSHGYSGSSEQTLV